MSIGKGWLPEDEVNRDVEIILEDLIRFKISEIWDAMKLSKIKLRGFRRTRWLN